MRYIARCADCAQATSKQVADHGPVRYFLAWTVLLGCLGACAVSVAASPDLIDHTTYDAAVRAIPFDNLTDDAQGRLWRIVSQPSIYRRLPVTRVQSDPDLHLFLVRHPEVVVNMWDLMGVTKVKVNRTGAFTFQATDSSGTTGNVELVYGDRETHVMIAEGTYQGPLLKRLANGRCVLVLKSVYSGTPGPETKITNQLDVFVQLDNVGAELIAKTLQPVVGKAADHNFIETTRFIGQVSQAAATRPNGMQQLSRRLTLVEPPLRDQFGVLTNEVYRRASGDTTRAQGE